MGEFEFLAPIPKSVVPVRLPSRGTCYPKGSAPAEGTLTLAPMTMVEEAMFNNAKASGADIVDNILRRCIQESIELNSLLASDKFFLFMMLRAVTYGPEYTFTWTCPTMINARETCGSKHNHTVKIPDDFKVKYLADEDKEPFTVRLPDSQRDISFVLLRGYDEPEIEKYTEGIETKRKQGISVVDTTMSYRLSRQIVKVDGNSTENAPREKVMAFINSLSARDSQFLRDKITFYTPGISTDITLVCHDCGSVHEWDLPFTADFFRANNPEPDKPVEHAVRPDVLPGDVVPGDDEHGPVGTEVVLRKAPGNEGTGAGNRKA
jgi:hypothetical protein